MAEPVSIREVPYCYPVGTIVLDISAPNHADSSWLYRVQDLFAVWFVLLRADVGHHLGSIPWWLHRIVLLALVKDKDEGLGS